MDQGKNKDTTEIKIGFLKEVAFKLAIQNGRILTSEKGICVKKGTLRKGEKVIEHGGYISSQQC